MAPLKELNGHDLNFQGGGIFLNCKGGNSENLGSRRHFITQFEDVCIVPVTKLTL